ncbi:hypothetical protein ACEQPO_30000 [Bacillus sp. SL00103]
MAGKMQRKRTFLPSHSSSERSLQDPDGQFIGLTVGEDIIVVT